MLLTIQKHHYTLGPLVGLWPFLYTSCPFKLKGREDIFEKKTNSDFF